MEFRRGWADRAESGGRCADCVAAGAVGNQQDDRGETPVSAATSATAEGEPYELNRALCTGVVSDPVVSPSGNTPGGDRILVGGDRATAGSSCR